MNQHELIMLSPYRFPGQHLLTLADEDMASWLNAYTALWHPALLWQAKGPPRCDSQYDHEQPLSGCIYALPESPPLYLPDDWEERVKAVGSVVFTATPDRAATLEHLKAALEQLALTGGPGDEPVTLSPCHPVTLSSASEELGFFFGIAWGHLLHASLVEAMEHENLLEALPFWDDVQSAIAARSGLPYTRVAPLASDDQSDQNADPADVAAPMAWKHHLRRAAEKLTSAREVLYPVTIHWLDLLLLDEGNLSDPWPTSLLRGNPINVLASGVLLERLGREQPEKLAILRERLQTEQAEVCGGLYREREDALLPVDSQLWNLQRGREVAAQILGQVANQGGPVSVFARQRFGFQPQQPLMLTSSGLTRCLLLTFDENSGLPVYQSVSVSWPSPDGKTVDGFTRNPQPVDSPQTFFNLGHHWFKTTREDHTAVVALVHKSKPPAVWYDDLMCLSSLAPVLGLWTTFGRFFSQASSGEHIGPLTPDDFHFDYLSERTEAKVSGPVSSFARHVRLRRRIDTCWTLAALQRGLAGPKDTLEVAEQLRHIEHVVEENAPDVPQDLAELEGLEKTIAGTLADRLLSRATGTQPGYLVLNPCGFGRRLALELEGAGRPLRVEGPVKACQVDGNLLRVVVEVPALGFAWIPREGPPGTTAPPGKMRLADAQSLTMRNEFYEVDIDPQTGGLKAIRDHKTRVNRLGQRLVFQPGSQMKMTQARVTSTGPALGEIITEGVLVDDHQLELARFRQRFRIWLGRPVLEMRIDLEPVKGPVGYPWFAYYGARFAWRDERSFLLRSSAGTGYVTTHPRPQTPDYLELRSGRLGTVIFPGGLPFHQRHEGRMLDVILVTEGETARTFDLAIALDREQPMQTAQGLTTPLVVVPTTKGPPHIGSSGWLFHLDSPHLLLSQMRPGKSAQLAPVSEPAAPARDLTGPDDAVVARLLECGGHSGQAEFRCARNPRRAAVLNAKGDFLLEASLSGDAVHLEVTPNDLIEVQLGFG
jgi:hypothetical protein